jgi:hypothetical protein
VPMLPERPVIEPCDARDPALVRLVVTRVHGMVGGSRKTSGVRESRGTSSLLCQVAFTGLWLRPQRAVHSGSSHLVTQGRYPGRD